MRTPAQLVAAIEAAMPNIYQDSDRRVLESIAKRLTPDAIAARDPEDEGSSVAHLQQIAETRLRNYPVKEDDDGA